METFESALKSYLEACQQQIKEYHDKNFPTLSLGYLETETGSKFVRVVRVSHGQRCVHSFVEIATGDILYPNSWKSPKVYRAHKVKDVRGNIYAEDHGLSAMNPHGVNTLR